jgi:hypothetical protein
MFNQTLSRPPLAPSFPQYLPYGADSPRPSKPAVRCGPHGGRVSRPFQGVLTESRASLMRLIVWHVMREHAFLHGQCAIGNSFSVWALP